METMQFVRYQEVDAFSAKTEELLKAYEHQNNIILGLLKKHAEKTVDETIRLLTVEQEGTVKMIGFQTLPHQMLYFFPENQTDQKVLEFYIQKLLENNLEIDCVMGESKSAKLFAELYAKAAEKKEKNIENLIIHRLEEFLPKEIPAGNFRAASLEDLNFLPYWNYAFEEEIQRKGRDLMVEFQDVSDRLSQTYLFETKYPFGNEKPLENFVPVALARWNAVSENCVRIGPVYTPPWNRNKGFATAVVLLLSKKLKEEGMDVMLYTNSENPISNACYRNIGFVPILLNARYQFE